jgi:hypothetical protein
MRRIRCHSAIPWGFTAILLTPLGVLAQDFTVDWWTVDGGGMAASGGAYELTGTIGQPDARNHPKPMVGGGFALTGGGWVIPQCLPIPADYDGDCDVDQADYEVFALCASGPSYACAADCRDRDFDADGDVDQTDFSLFQRCLSGEGNSADPDCTR